MKKLAIMVAVLGMVAMVARADLENITVNDGFGVPGTGIGGEVGEVEFGNVVPFDLQAFYYDRSTNELQLEGTYDFARITGETMGDIFIDRDMNGSIGIGDLAMKLTFTNKYNPSLGGTYAVYTVENLAYLTGATYGDPSGRPYIPIANPWTYADPSAIALPWSDNTFSYVSAAGVNKIYGLKIDGVTSFYLHNTMGCGNDVIVGKVPEPAILSMLGLGLFAIAAIGRRKK